jgi:hypothetical protein
MRRKAILFGILLTAILAAQFSCARAKVESSRRLWNEKNIKNYNFTMHIQKTGHATPMGTVAIEVRDGTAISMKRVENQWLGGDVEKCEKYNTIEKIFDIVENASGAFPDVFTVDFDSEFGYPKNLNLDPNRQATDDELSVKILQFEVVE